VDLLATSTAVPLTLRVALVVLALLIVVGFGLLVALVVHARRHAVRERLAHDHTREATPGADGPLLCPSCNRRYHAGICFCPFDARRLVHASDSQMVLSPGAVCPRCRRAFEGHRHCPIDEGELVPLPVWEATRGRLGPAAPLGIVGKICPRCASRYDLGSIFCARDGSELLTIN
jgi:uncharacterized protein YbaR (Trm112 family)